jgi:hypothetical protein
MAAAVASGAVALLLGERPNLSPNDVKVTLQMTATLMPGEGLLASGAGSMNAYAAAEFARGFVGAAMAAALNHEASTMKDIVATSKSSKAGQSVNVTFGNAKFRGRTYVWAKSVKDGVTLWSATTPNHSNRSTAGTAPIHGSSSDEDVIVWGTSADEDVIVWGTSADEDVIVWGNSADEDVIVWGTSADEDVIVWGNSADEDVIVWGN